MRKTKFLSAFIVLLWLSGCNKQMEIPKGYWISERGRPDVLITDEGNKKYMATVYHICHDGSLCPIKYPIIYNSAGIYIQAEGRILITYSLKKDELFLSPGGVYHRHPEVKMK